jgi:diketogulonate reductase-like aldo/keto reductase
MQITISPHLQSTYKLIQNAFPKGIELQSYLPLLALLSEEMSHRNLAEVVAYYSGKDYSVVLNDVYRVQLIDVPTSEAIANLREKLLICGYEEWLEEG